MNDHPSHPVRIEGAVDPNLSRWLWLVKWLLAIPHYMILSVLWLTLLVLSVVAFFAILFTGRYPRGIFDFNVGVLRWTWRVGFYSYGALGTDRYPPFALADVPDYPARLDVAYPERLSRGLVLVKSWLLAFPQLIVVGILLGGGGFAVSTVDDRVWGLGFETGLIGLLVLFAGVALLFTARYPQPLFDLVVGLDRWVARVAAYVLLMRDEYPPFRLDQGGTESGVPIVSAPAPVEAHARRTGTAGRVVLAIVGVIAGVVALGLLVAGGVLVAVDQTQRDDDGYLMSPRADFVSPTYAIVSERADVDADDAERVFERFLGTVRLTSESTRDVFVGIAPAAAVDAYLDGVEYDLVTGFDADDPTYNRHDGGAPAAPPADETFWTASASGTGVQSLEWEPEDGDWRAVALNADAQRGVATRISIGAELDSVLWIGIGLLVAGAVFAMGSGLAVTAAVRR